MRLLPASWRNPHLARLLAATGISEFGTEISNLAMPLTAITVLHASIFEVAALTACMFLPTAAFGLFAGAWVDRARKRPLMIASDVVRAASLASIPLAWALGALTLVQLYAVTLIVATLNILFEVAKQSYVPAVVVRDQLGTANSQLQLAEQGAAVAGPGIGGILVGWIGAPWAIAVDAISYLGSAGLIANVAHVETPATAQPKGRIFASIKEGIRFVIGHEYLRPLALGGATVGFFARMLSAILLVYLAREARLGASTIGLVLSVAGAGFVLGAVFASAVVRAVGLGRSATAGLLGAAAGLLVIGVAPPHLAAWSASAGMFIYGASAVLWQVGSTTLRQFVTPSDLLGRVTATMRVISTFPIPVAAIVGGIVGEIIGARPTLIVAGVGAAIAAVSILATKVPRFKELPLAA